MQIIKNINNNYAVAVDGDGQQLIVSGRGIGFGPTPRKVEDLTSISRSYYAVDPVYFSMINEIPEEIINVSNIIVDKARLLIDNPINSNTVFTLADHIAFCIQRYEKQMLIKLPILYDIQQLFEKEMEVGEYGRRLIRKKLGVRLPKDEAAYIALHFINAEEQSKEKPKNDDTIIEEVIKIIEKEFEIKVDKNNFNYARFVSHMHYLFKRGKSKHLIETDNGRLYQTMKQEYPKTYECSEQVGSYIGQAIHTKLTDEEKLYLMLHINRLYSYEDCNQ